MDHLQVVLDGGVVADRVVIRVCKPWVRVRVRVRVRVTVRVRVRVTVRV